MLRNARIRPMVSGLALVFALVTLFAYAPPDAGAETWWSVHLTAEVRDGRGDPAQGVPFAYWFEDFMNPDGGVIVTGADGLASCSHAGVEDGGYGFLGGYTLRLEDPLGVYPVLRTESDGFFGDTDNVWLHVTYYVADAGAIAGTVRDAAGLPMAGVGVALYAVDAGGSLQRVVETPSDVLGHYRFAGLGSRPYAVRFAYGSPYGPQFWGGTSEPASAGLISLAPDEQRLGVDGEPGVPLSGSLQGWVWTKRGFMRRRRPGARLERRRRRYAHAGRGHGDRRGRVLPRPPVWTRAATRSRSTSVAARGGCCGSAMSEGPRTRRSSPWAGTSTSPGLGLR